MAKMKENPKLNLNFPKNGKVQPKGFGDVSVDDQVTVVVKGTLKAVSHNAEEWNPGKQLSVDVRSCRILGPDKKTSMNDALKSAKSKV